MSEQDNFIEEEDLSGEDSMDFAGNRGEIRTQPSDPTVEVLHRKFQRNRLNIQPDFQRQFVWDVKTSSRLIESALLNVPLPSIYLSEELDRTESVIDGQQRLTAFFNFMDNKYKLSGLSVHEELNGKTYGELAGWQQDQISDCVLRVITFRKDSAPNLKFEVFQRLNSGAVALNDQEMRNCMYRGWYNKILRDLAEDKAFRKIMGFAASHKRMRDVQYVLRFAAFYFQGYLNYKSPMTDFMNREMRERQNISNEHGEELKTAFKTAVASVNSVFGGNAFRRWLLDSKSTPPAFRHEPKKFSAAIFDILMWSFVRADKGAIVRNADAIREAMIHLSTADEKFIDFITRGTSSVKAVTGRFDIWRKTLDEILQHEEKQPRCFSRALKQNLFDANPTCAICDNRIADIDDAAVDHIKQYWLGGKTIPENARLAHRYCNNTRPRKE